MTLDNKDVDIDLLAESISKLGLLQPIVLMGKYNSPPYELIVGQRRYLAHKKLNYKTIEAIIRKKLSDIKAKILSLSENIQRVELHHADTAEAITALYIHYNKNDRKVAEVLGLNLRTVRDYIKIEKQATNKAKRLLEENKVSKADVKRAIDAAQGDTQKADRLLIEISKLNKYDKIRAVSYGKKHPKASAQTIISEAKKPRMQKTITLNLTDDVESALLKAENYLSIEKESIALKALSEWLGKNGFLK